MILRWSADISEYLKSLQKHFWFYASLAGHNIPVRKAISEEILKVYKTIGLIRRN